MQGTYRSGTVNFLPISSFTHSSLTEISCCGSYSFVHVTHHSISMLRNIKYDLAIALPALMLASIIGAFSIAHS